MLPSDPRHALDHLVYGTSNVERTVDNLERLLHVRAAPGGRHQGRGTRNALIALSPTTYLEIIGPDPAQRDIASPRWFSIDTLTEPRLVTWAAKTSNLQAVVESARLAGLSLGPVASGSRARTDGRTLTWAFTDPAVVVADGVVPFFIDWGGSEHPAASAPAGPSLVALRAEHPEPSQVRAMLAALGLHLEVRGGQLPRLIATLSTPVGDVDLS